MVGSVCEWDVPPVVLKFGAPVNTVVVLYLHVAFSSVKPDNSTDVVPEGNDVVVGEVIVTIGGTISANVAVTDAVAAIVKEQAPLPEQAPDQLVKVEPELGVSESVTRAPLVNDAEQIVGHAMPEGEETTEPAPDPARVAERV